MTDEEIVKALEHCSHNRSCEYCYHNDEVGSGEIVCRNRLMGKALYLIHRLQSENAEQKAEIERLIKEKDKLHMLTDLQEANVNTIFENNMKLREEIKWLTKVMENFQRCVDNSEFVSKDMFEKEKNKNAELQKKVDELKVYLASEKICSKQAVEDAAKEILEMILSLASLNEYYDNNDLRSLAQKVKERYGVEVE